MSFDLDRAGDGVGASGRKFPSISIVVPTFYEAENIPLLVKRIEALKERWRIDLELLIMDDDSRDGTPEVVAGLGKDWVKLRVRKKDKGLSQAVIDGLAMARNEVVVVMDADLSHPPEKIPEMLSVLEGGADFVIGSRYVEGGTQDDAWGLFRWINSKVATLLSRPFTRVKDPMSGFFSFRRSALEHTYPLNPVGYKIGLELIVKGGFQRIEEIPIHFSQRKYGESKLSFKEQLLYLRHLWRLFLFKLFGRTAPPPGKPVVLEKDLELEKRKPSVGA